MKNPYLMLGIDQDATKKEISKAVMLKTKENMRTKELKPQELMMCKKQLLDPAKRMIADFLFPKASKLKREARCKLYIPDGFVEPNTECQLNPDAFNSL